MDFINRVKLPMLYKAIVECWENLDREEKSRIIMNYIDDIKLTKNSLNQYVVESVNFRTTFYKDFKKLYDDGFIDWKRKFIYDFNGIRIDSKVRYSEYIKIKTLTENNEALNLRVKTLNDTIKEKDNEISFLKSKIKDIQNTLEYWKDKFEKLISFLHSKLHSWYDKDDKYIDVVNDMYEDNALDYDDIEELDLSKEKDDFER